MIHHVNTLLWLKWAGFRHSMRNLSSILAVIVTVLMVVGAVVIGCAFGIGFFFLGAAVLPEENPIAILGILDGVVAFFLFLLLTSLMIEFQRSETIDFRKMLYLPVSLRTVFILNYFVSLLSPAFILFAIPVAGLILGLAIGFGAHMLLAGVLALAFLLMVTAWVYYLRGYILVLLENKRRRRTLLLVLPIFFITLSQLPNLVMSLGAFAKRNSDGEDTKKVPSWVAEIATELDKVSPEDVLTAVNAWVPLGWFPLGTHAVQQGNTATASLCFAGLAAFGGLGLGLGYRSTLRYYRGQTTGKAQKKPTNEGNRTRGRCWPERTLPFVDDDTAACAWTNFTALFRHPQARMGLIMPIIFGVIIFGSILTRGAPADSPVLRSVVPILLPALSIMASIVWMSNIFGADGEGFRSWMLLPTPRYKYILGKNLAVYPLVLTQTLILLGLSGILLRPSPVAVAVALLQITQLFLTACILGNLFSMYFPFRIPSEIIRRTSTKMFVAALASLVFFCFLPVFVIPTLFCAFVDPFASGLSEYSGRPVIGFLCSLVFLAGTLLAYRLSLKPMGALLARREERILEVLIRDKE